MIFFQNISNDYPLIGVFSSIILLLGLYQVGHLIFKIQILRKIFNDISNIKYQKIFIAINFILLIFYPLILYSNTRYLILTLGLTIYLLGFYKTFLIIKKKINNHKIILKNKDFKIDELSVYLTFLFLLLLSLSPNTHGDSLGYHFVVANSLIINGTFVPNIIHFHSTLAGAGEILIAIGLMFGSEQFGSLVQYSGLLSLLGIFKKINNKNKYYFLLLIITTPVILFLSSTAKPQLFHICANAVVFSMYFLVTPNKFNQKEKMVKILIAMIILLVSLNAKFNFILSGFLLGCYILYVSIKENNFKSFVLVSFLIFIIFYFPIIYWKYINYGGNIFQYFFSPVPLHFIGYEGFRTYLSRFARADNFMSFIVPLNFNRFTNAIGISIMYLLFLNFKHNKAKILFIGVTIYLFLNYYHGQFIGRTFLEPLFYIIIFITYYGVSYRFKIFEYICRLQSYIVIIAIIGGVYMLFPGSISKTSKDNVLSKNASGYSLFKWANTKLDKSSVVISIQRSRSLGISKFINFDSVYWIDWKDGRSKIYVNKMQKKNPQYFLTYGYTNQKPKLFLYKDCLGKLLFFKEGIGYQEARNPFNRGNSYDGYIYKFNVSKFPKCIIKKKK